MCEMKPMVEFLFNSLNFRSYLVAIVKTRNIIDRAGPDVIIIFCHSNFLPTKVLIEGPFWCSCCGFLGFSFQCNSWVVL